MFKGLAKKVIKDTKEVAGQELGDTIENNLPLILLGVSGLVGLASMFITKKKPQVTTKEITIIYNYYNQGGSK